MTVRGEVRWEPDPPGDWWGTAVFTLTNEGSAPVENPEIAFTVDARQNVAKNSGFEPHRPVGSNRVSGKLEHWELPVLRPGVPWEFSVGIGPNDGQAGVGPLPTAVTVNGDGPPPPPEGPTTPGNFRVTRATSTSLEVAWDASTSPAGIDFYELTWQREGGHLTGRPVPATSDTIADLTPDTLYRLGVYAVDKDGRESAVAQASGRTDGDGPPPPPGGWDVPSAPFLDLCRYPSPRISDYTAAGAAGLFLGFAVAGKHPSTTGRLTWGGNEKMWDSVAAEESSGIVAESTYKLTEIRAMQQAGRTPILSIGGAAGGPIEQVVTDVGVIVAEYEAVLDQYGLNHLDFDFEGGVEHDQPAMARHVEALSRLTASRPGLRFSYTLSVNTYGFNSGGKNLVKTLARGGLQPHAIQGMLMEMGELGSDRFDVARRTTEAMVRDIAAAGFAWSDTEIWSRVGLCPMFGRNNDGTRFTLDHMRQLIAFAREKQVAVVSGWDAYRDHNQWRIPECQTNEGSDNGQCTYVQQEPLDFSRVAATYTGRRNHPEPGPVPPVPPGPIPPLPPNPEPGCRCGNVTIEVNVTVNGEPQR